MSQKSAQLLKNFLHTHSITISEFARITDVSRFSIYKYLSGSPISRKVALRIEKNVLEKYRICLPHEKLID